MSNLYGLTQEQVSRLKRLLEAFESGSFLAHQAQKSQKKPPLETYLARTEEVIDGMVTDDTDPENPTYEPGKGEATLWKLDTTDDPEQLKAGELTSDVYNLSENSVGEGVLVQLVREPISGKLFIVQQRTINKAEMIDNIKQGDTEPKQAWLLKWNEDDEVWERTETKIDLYGDQGFRGMAFGKTDDVDSGDKIDVYFSVESNRWYGVVGGWYFHGDVVDDIAEGAEGEVKLNVGAGDDAREITVPAFSPYASVKKDDFVSVNWNTFSKHWDIGKFGKDDNWGCGLEKVDDEEDPDDGKVRVKVSDLAGCGLKEAEGEGCKLDVDPAAIAGPGLMPVPDSCKLTFDVGCGLTLDDVTGKISVYPDEITEGETGLEPGGDNDCGIKIKVGCGVWINGDGKLAVAHDELAGEGLNFSGECRLDVNIGCGLEFDDDHKVKVKPSDLVSNTSGLIVDESTDCGIKVKPGCGIWINSENEVAVAHDELPGKGLTLGSNVCDLDVNLAPDGGLEFDSNEAIRVNVGCGIWINGSNEVAVAHDELAGNGLVIGSNCQLDVDCDWIKANCVDCDMVRDCITPGCGIWWNGTSLEVAHDELAGDGLVIGSNCQLDVDCAWIKANCIDCAYIRECITPGCGIWWNGTSLEVAHDELAGDGLVIGSNCQLDIDCAWIKANCIDCAYIRDCITPGCGIWWNGTSLEVAHDELAGDGLVIGSNCTLDIDCSWIKSNCITPGCGLWYDGSGNLAVAHDELPGKGLTVGSNECEIDVALGAGLKFDGSEAVTVDVGCGLWLNGSKLEVAHDELAGTGLTVGSNCTLDVDCDYIKNNCSFTPSTTKTDVQFVSEVTFNSSTCMLNITYKTLHIPDNLGITVT